MALQKSSSLYSIANNKQPVCELWGEGSGNENL